MRSDKLAGTGSRMKVLNLQFGSFSNGPEKGHRPQKISKVCPCLIWAWVISYGAGESPLQGGGQS